MVEERILWYILVTHVSSDIFQYELIEQLLENGLVGCTSLNLLHLHHHLLNFLDPHLATHEFLP
jgi:hypothetical protein